MIIEMFRSLFPKRKRKKMPIGEIDAEMETAFWAYVKANVPEEEQDSLYLLEVGLEFEKHWAKEKTAEGFVPTVSFEPWYNKGPSHYV